MFQGFVASKSTTVDFILHFITRSSLLTGANEEITFRTKIALSPEQTLAPTLKLLKSRCSLYGEKDHEWSILVFKGDTPIILSPEEPVSSFKLSPGTRDKDVFMLSAKDALSIVSQEKKKGKRKLRADAVSGKRDLFSSLLSGEVLKYKISDAICFQDLNSKDEGRANGDLWVTNYRIAFVEDPGFGLFEVLPESIFIPLGMISNIGKSKNTVIVKEEKKEKSKDPVASKERDRKLKVTVFTVNTRDFRSISFAWSDPKKAKIFQKLVCDTQLTLKSSFVSSSFESQLPSFKFDPKQELFRQGYSEEFDLWRVTSRPKSQEDSNATLPRQFIVPASIVKSTSVLVSCALHRRLGRFPVYSWGLWNYDEGWHGTVVLRAERSRTEEEKKSILNGGDENLLLMHEGSGDSNMMISVFEAAGSVPPPLKDGESLVQDGQAKGFFSSFIHVYDTGEEELSVKKPYMDTCDPFEFLNLPKLEELEQSIALLAPILLADGRDQKSQIIGRDFLSALDDSKWLKHVQKMVRTASRVVRNLKSETILIQNGGPECNNDSTLVCLVLLLVDSHYRTLEGFCTLVEKEWVNYSSRWSISSPITPESELKMNVTFIFFLQCVFEFYQQRPTWFEFNDNLLLFLAEASHTYRFSNFFFDSELERSHKLLHGPSVWQYVLWKESEERFKNKEYAGYEKFQIFLPPEDFSPAFWGTFFWRHSMVVAQADKQCAEQLQDASSNNRTRKVAASSKGGDLAANSDKSNLSLASIQITTLKRPEWSRINYITVLVLSENRLTSIPPEIGVLENLKHLVLQMNHISFVSDIIGAKLTNLENLSLSQNRISGFAENIGNVKNLQNFNLQKNNISVLPSCFCELTSLKVLMLNSNHLTKLPGSFSKLCNLERLDLHQNQIIQLPGTHIETLVNLRSINLSGNNLVVMPEAISCLINLYNLDLTANRLGTIPEGLGKCTSIKNINLSNNPLEYLPESLGLLKNLENLESSAGKLVHLPFSIGGLHKLTRLMLSKNKLVDIPLSIKHLKHLRDLNISFNKLTSVSHGIGQCSSLSKLDISHNEITELPSTLSHLHGTLQTFAIDHNPIVTPPPEVLEKGASGILGFLKDLLEDSQKIYRIKLMVVGQENVGKTTTITALAKNWARGVEHQLFSSEKRKGVEGQNVSTDGIDIGSFTFPFVDPKKKKVENMKSKKREKKMVATEEAIPVVNVSVWDFAGQEVYYTTHQFFLSRRSVFLLLFSLVSPSSEARVEFWLQSLKTRVPNADLIIVGTHAEDPSLGGLDTLGARMKELKSKYKKLFPKFTLNVLAVSATENINIDELREVVQTQMCKQRHMGEQLPKSYLSLEQILEQTKQRMRVPMISLTHLKTIGQMVGHMEPDQTKRAASLLHDMGSLVYFKDEPGLSQMVILNPTWLTKMMATLFTTKHSWVKNGTIQHNALAQIWKEYPQEIYSSLLYLLQKFEICHQLEEDIVEVVMKNLGIFYVKPSAGAAVSEPQAPGASLPSSRRENSLGGGRPVELTQGEIRELDAPPFDPFGVSLVPALLPSIRPDADILKHWKMFPQDHSVTLRQIDRTYTFSFMPKGFFSRLVVKLFHIAHPVSLWASGFLARPAVSYAPDSEDWILVEHLFSENTLEDDTPMLHSLQLRDNDLSVTVRSKDWLRAQELFVLVIDLVDELAGEWANLKWTRSCLSPNSILGRDSAPEVFSVDALEEMVIEGKSIVAASETTQKAEMKEDLGMLLVMGASSRLDTSDDDEELETEFPISRLCPDIALANYKGVRVDMESEVDKGRIVGEGGFALVYLGSYRGKDVALKELILNVGPDSDPAEVSSSFREFRQEINIMAALNHPNVVNLLAVSMKPFCLICEFVPCGNLYDFIHEYEKPLPWKLRHKISVDLALGIQYMHSFTPPIVHIDMKTPNIMLMSLDDSAPVCAKITDFGTSRFVHRPVTGRFVDNPVWLAPEVLKSKPYGVKVDTYAYGVMCWELLTRESFFGDVPFMSDMEDKIVNGERPSIPSETPKIYKDIIMAGWHQMPDSRPEFSWFLKKLELLREEMVSQSHAEAYATFDAEQSLVDADRVAELKRKAEEEETKIRLEAERQALLKDKERKDKEGPSYDAADEDAFLAFLDTDDGVSSLALKKKKVDSDKTEFSKDFSMMLDQVEDPPAGVKWGLRGGESAESSEDLTPELSRKSALAPKKKRLSLGKSGTSTVKKKGKDDKEVHLGVTLKVTAPDGSGGETKGDHKRNSSRRKSRSRRASFNANAGSPSVFEAMGKAMSDDTGGATSDSSDDTASSLDTMTVSSPKKRERLGAKRLTKSRKERSLDNLHHFRSNSGKKHSSAPHSSRMAQPSIAISEANLIVIWVEAKPIGSLMPTFFQEQNPQLYLLQVPSTADLLTFLASHESKLGITQVITNQVRTNDGGDKAADNLIKTLRAHKLYKTLPVIVWCKNAEKSRHLASAKGSVYVTDKAEQLPSFLVPPK